MEPPIQRGIPPQNKFEVLKQFFGHDSFRPGQETLIDGILAGRDVLGIMPTGGGKSLCYQVPALLLPGVTIVISPLISLMKDQVAALTGAGIRAAYVNSSLSLQELDLVYHQAAKGAYRLLYIAPERLEAPGFVRLISRLSVPLVAVDEAHCISQWGQDFRPSYLKIAQWIQALPRRPVVAAFTATATQTVQEDILRLLELQAPVRQVTGFDRPNLFFDVQTPKDKWEALLALLRQRRGKSGIVYCSTREKVERVSAALCEAGIPAARYHAGMEDAARQRNQDDFQFDRRTVMVATNAFGMGIDKSNVSFVIHYNMPKSIEAYYQEAGRAGRDGEPADCILLFSAGDVQTAKYLIEHGGNDELDETTRSIVRQQDYERLSQMVDYCQTRQCYRGKLLDYFGQTHDAACGNCGNCQAQYETVDITVPAQMLLSCVVRIRRQLGYSVGKTLVLRTLRGSRDQRVLELGLDRLPTYGLLQALKAAQLRSYADYLEQEGYLQTNNIYNTWEPTALARKVLFEGQTVLLPVRLDRAADEKQQAAAAAAAAPLSGQSEELYAALKDLRNRLAQKEKVPAYLVFSNATLADMARKRPATLSAFLEVSGVGNAKAEKYGRVFLKGITEFCQSGT